ncbi:MAG: ABC transporter permease [Syntrophorhabdales bacterium]
MNKESEDAAPVGAKTSELRVPTYRGEFVRIIRVFCGRRIALVGLIIIATLILTSIFAPWVAPYDPYQIDFSHKLLQPSCQHLLGTDPLGRDTFSRIIFGSRISLMVGLGAVGIAAVIGGCLGLVAGYFGGVVSTIVMRLVDALMAIPMLLIALVVASVLGGGSKNVILALGIAMISVVCRMMVGQVLSVKEKEFVLAGRATGMSHWRMIAFHILPNTAPPLLVVITIGLGTAILSEAVLSFLGLGILPPEAAWGSMISDGYKYLMTNPILSFAPGMAIMLTVFGFNMMGDGLRDALDPTLRGVI